MNATGSRRSVTVAAIPFQYLTSCLSPHECFEAFTIRFPRDLHHGTVFYVILFVFKCQLAIESQRMIGYLPSLLDRQLGMKAAAVQTPAGRTGK